MTTRLADTLFYLGILTIIYPDCPIFNKNYNGERKMNDEIGELDDAENFFSNLPESSIK